MVHVLPYFFDVVPRASGNGAWITREQGYREWACCCASSSSSFVWLFVRCFSSAWARTVVSALVSAVLFVADGVSLTSMLFLSSFSVRNGATPAGPLSPPWRERGDRSSCLDLLLPVLLVSLLFAEQSLNFNLPRHKPSVPGSWFMSIVTFCKDSTYIGFLVGISVHSSPSLDLFLSSDRERYRQEVVARWVSGYVFLTVGGSIERKRQERNGSI